MARPLDMQIPRKFLQAKKKYKSVGDIRTNLSEENSCEAVRKQQGNHASGNKKWRIYREHYDCRALKHFSQCGTIYASRTDRQERRKSLLKGPQ